LLKVKDATYREGDQLINAVYVARPKDSYKSISSMIYGSEDKVKDLKAANPGIKKVKTGQKIYYNSPKRATDESKIMNYYEESGMPAETYVTKKGDNLKKLSKGLLGFPDAWKEIWMTNASVESKEKLNEGTEIKYWKDAAGGAPAQQMAADGNRQPTPMPQEANPPPPAQADLPPPPPQQAQANLPPPPPPPQQAQANLPPPPPPPEAAPPPPTPQMAKKPPKIAQPGVEEGAMDDQTMMAMAAAGIVIAAIAALIIIRKKKAQKAAASNFEQMGA
jgi:LPXTG-motif cell wall-anchored protein